MIYLGISLLCEQCAAVSWSLGTLVAQTEKVALWERGEPRAFNHHRVIEPVIETRMPIGD